MEISLRSVRRGYFVGLLLMALSTTGSAALQPELGASGSRSDCDLTLTPDQSLQEALHRVDVGGTICLAPGSWPEIVEIEKPLIVRGAGVDATRLTGEGLSVGNAFTIRRPVALTLEDLTIQGFPGDGIDLRSYSQATLRRVRLIGQQGHGIDARDDAQLHLEDVWVTQSLGHGLTLRDRARAEMLRTSLENNGGYGLSLQDTAVGEASEGAFNDNHAGGIRVRGSAQLILQQSDIRLNDGDGLSLQDAARAALHNSRLISNEENGIRARGSSQLTVQGTQVNENGTNGLDLAQTGEAPLIASLEQSVVQGNGRKADCNRRDPPLVCSGLKLQGKVRLTLRQAEIRENMDWGIAAWRRECGFSEDRFSGVVDFQSDVVVEGNNHSGEHAAAGNPGWHPFGGRNRPPGQVCLAPLHWVTGLWLSVTKAPLAVAALLLGFALLGAWALGGRRRGRKLTKEQAKMREIHKEASS